MDWMEILQKIFELCIIPLLGVITAFVVKLIQQKAAEVAAKTNNQLASKYINMLAQTISECVIATNQTYVDALKAKDAFNEENQKEALNKTYTAVMAILSDEAKAYLASIYGDLNTYITTKIEEEVKYNKET